MRRYSWFKLVGVLLLVFSLILSGCAQKAKTETVPKAPGEVATNSPEQKPVNLKYGAKNAPTSFMSKIDIAMFEKIEKETNGKVKVTPFWAETLTKAAQWYTETSKGTSDITNVLPGANEEHFPLYVLSTNLLFDVVSNNDLRAATNDLWEKRPELMAEWKSAGVIPLSSNSPGPVWLHTVKPVRSIADIKGMTINCTDENSKNLYKALGANVVRMTLSESYQALQKGIIDGMSTGYDALMSFKLGDVTKYSTEMPYSHPHVVIKVMSMKAWNDLTPDTQKIIKANGKWWDTEFIKAREQIDIDTTAYVKEQKHELIKLSAADNQKIVSTIEGNVKKAAEQANAIELYNASREIAKKYKK